MKTTKLVRAVAVVIGLAVSSCAPSSTPESIQPEGTMVAGPLPGENFVVVYSDGAGVHRRDTREGRDEVIVPRSPAISFGEGSFGTGLAAFARRSADSTWLEIVLDDSDSPQTVHRGTGGRYTFAWSGDRSALAFGYRPAQGGATETGVWIVSGQGEVTSVGCSASNRVYAWRANGQLLVGDASNVYTVNSRTCGTIATLPGQGKANFAFASGGRRLSFSRGAELFIANSDGSGSQKIADRQVAARDAAWRPDGSRVAFVINSPRFANRTHVAVHDVASSRVSYNDRESLLGVPNESNPCWSPDGQRLLFDRVFDRSDGVETYLTKQKIVKQGDTETVVFEELLRDGRRSSTDACVWIDETHILIGAAEGFRVINVTDRSEYAIGDVEGVMMVSVFPAR